MKLNIFIITYAWPPYNAIGTYRPYAWAKYWKKLGHNITIITAKKNAFDSPKDLNLPLITGVKVIEITYKYSGKLFGAILNLLFFKNIIKNLIELYKKKTLKEVDPRTNWYKYAKIYIPKLTNKIDVIVSTSPTLEAHKIASDIKKRNPKAYWAADFRDLPYKFNLEKKRIVKITKELILIIKNADSIFTVSKAHSKILNKITKKKIFEIKNGFDENFKKVKKKASSKKIFSHNLIRIVHTGTIYPIYRDPTPILKTFALLSKEGFFKEISVTLDFYGANVYTLQKILNNPEFKPFIRLMGHVSPKKIQKVQQSADILLLLESSNLGCRGVITGKIFEYIISGRPIVCFGSHPNYEIGQILSKTGTGISIPNNYNVKIYKKFFKEVFFNKRLEKIYKPRKKEILKYSRRIQAIRMIKIIAKEMQKMNI
jgi:hypothetical protein